MALINQKYTTFFGDFFVRPRFFLIVDLDPYQIQQERGERRVFTPQQNHRAQRTHFEIFAHFFQGWRAKEGEMREALKTLIDYTECGEWHSQRSL